MPFYWADGENITSRISGYRLSHIANDLKFFKPSLRYPNRVDSVKSRVLRALCDHYPDAWPSVERIAEKSHCSTAQARRALRELEFQDRLIVDVNSRYWWRWPTADEIQKGHPAHIRIWENDGAGKQGGRGKDCTPQYAIHDRKIYDIYCQQRAWKIYDKKHNQGKPKTQSGESNQTQSGEAVKPDHGSTLTVTQTQSREIENPITGASKEPETPSPLIAEPTILLTDYINQQQQPREAEDADISFENPTGDEELSDSEIMGTYTTAMLEETGETLNTTARHRKSAVTFFRKYGRESAMSSWRAYLQNYPQTVTVYHNGDTRKERRKWPLQHFIDSGAAEDYANSPSEDYAAILELAEARAAGRAAPAGTFD